jgi:choline dehydrogenase-like flavoprotein
MKIDLDAVPSETEFKSEICIIGAGIAGLLLANRLAGYGLQVHLLEAGGMSLEERSQALYKSEMQGVIHNGTTEGRFRTFGGSSTRWGGQILSYTDEVFQTREMLDNIGWPISEADIRTYYGEIFKIMGVNNLPFTDEVLQRFGTRELLQSPDVRVRLSKFSPFYKRNLAKTIGRRCLASNRITVLFHANAISVDLDAEAVRITSATAMNYRGGRFKFKAREFIICTGTIETSRLLLSSNSVHPCGVGNLADQVGRFFHDHLTVKALRLGEQAKPIFGRFFSPYYVRGTLHSPKLEATASLQERLRLPQVMAQFFIHEGEGTEFSLLRQTLEELQRWNLTLGRARQLPLLLKGVARTMFALKVKGRRLISPRASVSMNIEAEQLPRPDSRIQISKKVNVLGIPETIVNWKISNEDGDSMRRYASVMDVFLKSIGMTHLDWNPRLQDDAQAWVQAGIDNFHPMGGTRMGTSQDSSVVYKNLRVHGLANLYIASCSVFPSGGSSNPTFTMMALACRLADFLQHKG